MTRAASVPSAAGEFRLSSSRLSSPVRSSAVGSPPVAPLPPDIVHLLDVLARIELRRRRARLHNLTVAQGTGGSHTP